MVAIWVGWMNMRGKEEEIRLQTTLLWNVSRFNPFFNIYRKPLEKIICWCGVMCLQYADGTYLYSGTIGRCSESHNLVSGVWIRENRLRHHPKKVEWLLMQRTIDFRSVPSLALDRIVLGKSRLTIWRSSWTHGSWGAFVESHLVYQLYPYLKHNALKIVAHTFVLSQWAHYNALHRGLSWKINQKHQRFRMEWHACSVVTGTAMELRSYK